MILARSLGHEFPKFIDGRVGAAFIQKNSGAGDMPVGGFEHEVEAHGGRSAIQIFFAGMMKMKLSELVPLGADEHEVTVSGGIIDAHGREAIVDDVERAALEIEAERRKCSFLRLANVDGGLLLTIAGSVGRVQLRPMLRACGTFVAPGSFPLRARSG